METTIRLLDSAARRHRGRKRPRQREATRSLSEASTDTTPVIEEEALDEEALDQGLQQRLKDAVQALVTERHRFAFCTSSSAAFAARTAVGAWLASQAAKPQQFGLEWAAQLYVCFFLVIGAYRVGPESFQHLEMLQVEDLISLITFLGRARAAGSTSSVAERRLMMAARQWSRSERSSTEEAMVKASRQMRDEKRVRLAVEGVLFNAHRANRLFE